MPICNMRLCGWFLCGQLLLAALVSEAEPPVLPEFTQSLPAAWINSSPLTTADLKNKVVLMDIWTFDCWNCYRSFPWLHKVEERFSTHNFTVVGIHSPEFEHERHRNAVIKKTHKFQLNHPIMLDNDFAYWRALGNRYWPTFYVIDKKGHIRATFIGETHSNTPRAQKIEKFIALLLAE